MSAEQPTSTTAKRSTVPTEASPIADLSYRTYDGPIHSRGVRWWIVTVAGLRLVKKKAGFWILVVLCALPYLFTGVQLYFSDRFSAPNPLANNEVGQKFASLFFQAFSGQQLFLFLIALMLGAGAIAADNRANALLVYLSKPLTKGDYLLGKFMTVFLGVFASSFAPALLFYLYCLTGQKTEDFLKPEPWLALRVLGASLVPAIIHAGVIVGFSAWSKTPRMAGAIYAGFYFVSTAISMIFWGALHHGDPTEGALIRHLNLGGIVTGIGQNIHGVGLNMVSFRRGGMPSTVEPPEILPLVALGAALVLLGVGAARARIRAVEVVSG